MTLLQSTWSSRSRKQGSVFNTAGLLSHGETSETESFPDGTRSEVQLLFKLRSLTRLWCRPNRILGAAPLGGRTGLSRPASVRLSKLNIGFVQGPKQEEWARKRDGVACWLWQMGIVLANGKRRESWVCWYVFSSSLGRFAPAATNSYLAIILWRFCDTLACVFTDFQIHTIKLQFVLCYLMLLGRERDSRTSNKCIPVWGWHLMSTIDQS